MISHNTPWEMRASSCGREEEGKKGGVFAFPSPLRNACEASGYLEEEVGDDAVGDEDTFGSEAKGIIALGELTSVEVFACCL